MKKKIITIASLALAGLTAFSFAGCGGKSSIKSNTADAERTFTYYIPKEDGTGVGGKYDSYDQNPSIIYLTQDPFTYKTATKQGNTYVQGEEVSNNVALRFTSATTGQEQTQFIANLNNGVDILDMNYATETAQTMYESGKLMDLTYWVENYMPNYLAVAEKFGIDNLIATRDSNGNKQYLQIYSIYENINWQYYGYQYRRDWLLEYGKTFDTTTGAIGTQTFKEANPTWGWNGEGAEKKWTDGIIFPSYYGLQYTSDGSAKGMGTLTYNQELYDYMRGEYTTYSQTRATELETTLSNVQRDFTTYAGQWPATISDWEWMLDIFQIAVNNLCSDRGYCMNIYQSGYVATGNLISSFGGTGAEWQKTGDGSSVVFGPDNSALKVYTDTMNKWWNNGWIDRNFQSHTDLMWRTDEANVRQGYAGLYFGMNDQLFDGMDLNIGLTKGIYTDGMPYPINDKYGTADNKYKIPETLYAANYETGAIMVSTAAKDKDLAALFTMLDKTYTAEMGACKSWGLTSEMLATTQEGVQKLYADLGYPNGTTKYNAESKSYYRHEDALDVLMDDQYVVSSRRLVGLEGAVLGYEQKPRDQYENYIWNYFPDKGFLTKSFFANLNNNQYTLYTDKVGQLRSTLSVDISKFIKGEKSMGSWDGWYSSLKSSLGIDNVTKMLNNKWQSLNNND